MTPTMNNAACGFLFGLMCAIPQPSGAFICKTATSESIAVHRDLAVGPAALENEWQARGVVHVEWTADARGEDFVIEIDIGDLLVNAAEAEVTAQVDP